jgi:hypothetical protein
MPINSLKNLSKKYKISYEKSEEFWNDSKEIALKSYDENDDKFWPTVMIITKNKIKEYSKRKLKENNILNFNDFLNERIYTKKF